MATVGVKHFNMFIGGEWVDAEQAFEIHNPANGELAFTAARGTVEHADRAVEAALAAHRAGEWRNRTPEQRGDVLAAIADRVGEELGELAELEALCNGATIRQAAGFHVGFAPVHLAHFADLARRYAFEEPGPAIAYPTLATTRIRREPLGVCVGIVPWNFPLLLAIWKLGPALAAGNTMVMKPDEKTPLTLLELARIAQECGLPDGVLNVVTGEGLQVGARLVAHPDVAKVAFTGSTEVGREVMRLASGTVKRVTLELGGKSPVIVLDDADVETAVDAAIFGCMMYTGQMCESGTRLLLPDALHEEFVARMVERVNAIKIGDTMDYDTDLGPLVSKAQRERVLGYVELAREEGATVACGGGVPAGFEHGYYVEPTILTDVTNDMRVAQEEIFGPVLCVLRYQGEDEAVAIANDTIYGLAAAVWSTDDERALALAERLEAGSVWLNEAHAVNCLVPFGGYKQSGVGRELGARALDHYTQEKVVHLDLSRRRDRHVYDVVLSQPPS